ncbi:Hypothetical protein ORPV_1071 [Orpheovirus IHUMI-LCC2]|uniref:Uncharacterized protein n=1 Tax=Orpheovirus IHUMI-LCC2 TaxID=2023057 RepID=A0A2I2L5Z6_9VIRU|nr:Hypothetical protein ORPV_1071 [Orpheovirus IHUMI-LCC2]SNW62975.1 Hypothetical protein ORPV_1071 [Orpheovirus IHUMI-LCC2]
MYNVYEDNHLLGEFDNLLEAYNFTFLEYLSKYKNIFEEDKNQFYDKEVGWYKAEDDDEVWDTEFIIIPSYNTILNHLNKEEEYKFLLDEVMYGYKTKCFYLIFRRE